MAPRAAAAAPVAPGPTNEQIAGYLNAGIWGIVAFLVLAALPRAIVRWRHPSARQHGMQLKVTRRGQTTPPTHIPGSATPPSPATPDTICELPSTPFDHRRQGSDDLLEKQDARIMVDHKESPGTPIESSAPTSPARVASWGSVFFPIYRHLNRPFWFTGYSIGLAFAFALYTGVITFGILYKNLPSFGPRRAGWLVVGQLPLIIFLGTKNNLLGFVLGVGYEKLNVWHRWVGKTILVCQFAHVTGYLVLFAKSGKLTAVLPTLYDGWIALSGLCLLAIFSIPAVRKSAYGLFWHAHWVGYILMFVGVSFHAQDAWHYTVAGMSILAIDHVCRLFKTTFVMANITALPELKCTRIEVPHLTRGWRAGQHVRLRAVSSQMGVASLFEAHPFTIASVSDGPRGEGLILYVKAAGDWTNRLYDIASGSGVTDGAEKIVGVGAGAEQGMSMRMVLEGPYGGPGHDVLSSFSSAFIVAGGSGITFGLSTVDEIIREAELYRAKTKLVHLVWVVQDPSSLIRLMLVLTTFVDRVSRLSTIDVTISVYYTRAIPHSLTELVQNTDLPPNMHLHPGRPHIKNLLNEFVDRTKALPLPTQKDELCGLVVGACGPASLLESVKEAERGLSVKKRDSVGGVEIVEEMFGW